VYHTIGGSSDLKRWSVNCSCINARQSHSGRVWTLSTNDTVSANIIWAIQEERKAPGPGIEVNPADQHSS